MERSCLSEFKRPLQYDGPNLRGLNWLHLNHSPPLGSFALNKIRVVAQDITASEIKPGNLTTDCYIVKRKDGVIDIIKARRMVDIFDHYYDLGIDLLRIDYSGGRRNPKFQEPEF